MRTYMLNMTTPYHHNYEKSIDFMKSI